MRPSLLPLLTFIVDVSIAFFHSHSYRYRRISENALRMSNEPPVLGHTDIKIASLNVLAPCYNNKRVGEERTCEADTEEEYLKRHERICEKLLETEADVICLQEFWLGCNRLKNLYDKLLCEEGGYIMKKLRRTSHWRAREDGLAVLVKNATLEIQDYRNILFHDCGDRVALLMLLSVRPEITQAPPQQFIVVNTHLLFPHNAYSTNIRLREATKILGYAELYRQRELCTTICDRADVRLPVIVVGDFNGSPNGKVHQYFLSQNFHSAVDERMKSDGKASWVSHRSHRKQLVPVDHIFYSNPSKQTSDNLPPVPDWTNLVFREVFQTIVDRYGTDSLRSAFSDFDQSGSAYIDRELFKQALINLGFMGEGKPSLTPEEIEVLVDSADYDGNGKIDYVEFVDRFLFASKNENQRNPMREYFLRARWLNEETEKEELDFEFILPAGDTPKELNSTGSFIEAFVPVVGSKTELLPLLQSSRPLGDLQVKEVSIFPPELERGEWPEDYSLSDHGIVQVTFSAQVLGPIPEEEMINPAPVARRRRQDLREMNISTI